MFFLFWFCISEIIDYCTKNKNHALCGIDCLRSPNLCPGHQQIGFSKKTLKRVIDFMNKQRRKLMDEKIKIRVCYAKLFGSYPKYREYHIVKANKLNSIVSR